MTRREKNEAVGRADLDERRAASFDLIDLAPPVLERLLADGGGSPLAAFVTDADGVVLEVRGELHGARMPAPGQDWLELTHGDEKRTDMPASHMAPVRRPDGRVAGYVGLVASRPAPKTLPPVAWAAFTLECELARRAGTVDALEIRRLDAALKEQRRRADELFAVLGLEMRNPLASVVGASDVLRAARPKDATVLWATGIIERQARLLSCVLDELDDLGRPELGPTRLQRRPVDLRDLVERAIESVQGPLEAGRHALITGFGLQPIVVEGDPDRIVQAIAHVLAASLRRSVPGGPMEVTGEREGDRAVIRVRFTAGVNAEVKPADGAADRPPRSALEMWRAATILEWSGGSLQEGTDAGAQGEIVIRLPWVDDVVLPAAEPEHATGKRLRILIVEDNPDVAETLSRSLRMEGHDVGIAYDGPQALEAAARRCPDAVLLDLELPGMDGYEVCKRLRDRGLSCAPILAVTGYGQRHAAQRTLKAGFDAHLTKPVDLDALRKALSEAPSEQPHRNKN